MVAEEKGQTSSPLIQRAWRFVDRRFYLSITFLACAGLAFASYLFYLYMSQAQVTFCTSGTGCDVVRESEYSTLLGIPVALLGVGVYLLIILVAVSSFNERFKKTSLAIMATGSIAFFAYLTYIEAFVIHAFCPYCIASTVSMVAIFMMLLVRRPFVPGVPGPQVFIASAVFAALMVLGLASLPRDITAHPEAGQALDLAASGAVFEPGVIRSSESVAPSQDVVPALSTTTMPVTVSPTPVGETPTPTHIPEETASANPYALGPAVAPVVVEEFAHFMCPYCRAYALGPSRRIIEDYVKSGRVHYVFRNFPMGGESIRAAAAAACAAEAGRFWSYHDTLFGFWDGESQGVYTLDNLTQFARNLDIDVEAFTTCLSDGHYVEVLERDIQDAKDLGITGVPTVFINGRRVLGLREYSVYQDIINQELVKAQ